MLIVFYREIQEIPNSDGHDSHEMIKHRASYWNDLRTDVKECFSPSCGSCEIWGWTVPQSFLLYLNSQCLFSIGSNIFRLRFAWLASKPKHPIAIDFVLLSFVFIDVVFIDARFFSTTPQHKRPL